MFRRNRQLSLGAAIYSWWLQKPRRSHQSARPLRLLRPGRGGPARLVAIRQVQALTAWPVDHRRHGGHQAELPRTDELPSSRDAEQEEGNGEHTLVADPADVVR